MSNPVCPSCGGPLKHSLWFWFCPQERDAEYYRLSQTAWSMVEKAREGLGLTEQQEDLLVERLEKALEEVFV